MDTTSPSTGFAGEPRYAGFWIRVLAYLIDVVLIFAVLYILDSIGIEVLTTEVTDDGAGVQTNWLGTLLYIIYEVTMTASKHQGTVGKIALGIKVIDEKGGRISIPRSIGRYFAKILSAIILGIGYIMVAFTKKKTGLHDMICTTFVVYRK